MKYLNKREKRGEKLYKKGYVEISRLIWDHKISFDTLEEYGLIKSLKHEEIHTALIYRFNLTKKGETFFKKTFFYDLIILRPKRLKGLLEMIGKTQTNIISIDIDKKVT